MTKKILIGITGSIAAYKTAFLIRLLVKKGFEVKVVMTRSATGFITPLTLSVLSKNRVYIEFTENDQWNNHVDLGLWADLFIIAPASANTIGKMANGIADNLLLTVYLSARCKIAVAPAMDVDMYNNINVQANINKLKSQGIIFLDVDKGELASGLIGEGRMMEPEKICDFIDEIDSKKDLEGKKILITAGPTHEYIDPVRFIGNASSGKMGLALAKQCVNRGANVTLVLGPANLEIADEIELVNVVSAQQMFDIVMTKVADTDIFIFAAAVADYKPIETSSIKIKKSGEVLDIKLTKTPDIAESIGHIKRQGQKLIGFALENDSEMENALSKMKKKNFDMIVLNSLNDQGAGFGYDTNKVTIIRSSDNKIMNFELKDKNAVAKDIIDQVLQL